MRSGSIRRNRWLSEIKAVVFKVSGETNTDDLSPAQDAWSRPDIPLHAKAMYKMQREGLQPEEPGSYRAHGTNQGDQGAGPSCCLCGRRGRNRLIAKVGN